MRITDDLEALLDVLPANIRHAVEKVDDSDRLLEIILDLGRVPTARFVDREVVLQDKEITRPEIDHVVERVGDFDTDNRSGIERTLQTRNNLADMRDLVEGDVRFSRMLKGVAR